MIMQREGDRRYIDPRPGEGREAVGLVGFGVGQREGVSAPAVEGVAEMEDSGSQLARPTRGLVLPAFPVEGDLEGVLHRQRTSLDEEQMGRAGSPNTRTNDSTNSA